MTAGFGEHPAVARRRVRLALRKARQGTDLNQSDVAARLGWSLSKVQRIELGDVAVSLTDLRALADLYGSFTAEEFEGLAEDARISKRQRWWTAAEYREHLTPTTIKLLGFEAEAAAIRVYQSALIPGVLQTSEVAGEILRFWNPSDDERFRVRHTVRMLRRKQLLEREDAPAYYLVLDEGVLDRLGEPRVAAEQLESLQKDAEIADVHIRILPPAAGGRLGLLGPFTLLDLDESDPDDAVLYRESIDTDEIIDDPRLVRRHREHFELMWANALSEDVSLGVITAKAAQVRSEADRLNS